MQTLSDKLHRKICIKDQECVGKGDEYIDEQRQKNKQHDFIDLFLDAESADVEVIGNISPTDEGAFDKTSKKVLSLKNNQKTFQPKNTQITNRTINDFI